MPQAILAFGDVEKKAASPLIDLALAEDLHEQGDLTCQALIEPTEQGEVAIVARCPGVLAGLPLAQMVFDRLDGNIVVEPELEDGVRLDRGSQIARVSGPLRALLSGERVALNFLTHLCGVATQTRRFVDVIAGTGAKVFDTRKTLPGYRVLEKYAVRAGGGNNHRMGLYDGVLIKDNHLADWLARGRSIAEAVRHTREAVPAGSVIEVEVDNLDQLRDALEGGPDIVLLDNMDPRTLAQAVGIRDSAHADVRLEASGSVSLEMVREIAETGVERISVGAITHSAVALDIAFDWRRRR